MAENPAGQDLALIHRRIAQLHSELAEAHSELAENQLADTRQRAVMDDVPAKPTTQPSADRLMTVGDVAERLSVDARTVRNWRREGRMPVAFSEGGVIRWERQTIQDWIEARTAP